MARLPTKVYHFSVEGETERWYLQWLQSVINEMPDRTQNVSIPYAIRNPLKHAKTVTVTAKTITMTHLQDYESNEIVHVQKWQRLLDDLARVSTLGRGIKYNLGYCNYTFELWLVLHKGDCAGSFIDRTKYLDPINRLFGEAFENLDQYKHEANFKRVLGKLTLQNVIDAVGRAERIMQSNREADYRLVEYRRYTYYRENPSLSIQDVIKEILKDCSLM